MSLWKRIEDEELKKILAEREKVKKKYEFKSIGRQVIDSFIQSEYTRAVLDYESVKGKDGKPAYKSATGAVRALGRVLFKVAPNHEIFEHEGQIIIRKLSSEEFKKKKAKKAKGISEEEI